MPVVRVTVIAVSNRGDEVVVWGRAEDDSDDSDPVGYTFQTRGEHADVRLAERASELAYGTEAVIEYVAIAKDWDLARGLITS